jgi:tetratricopeptide (TPR) repeat protein
MDYQTYCDKIYEGAGLVEKEEYEAALEKFQEIVNSDVTDLDKALMCNNIAVTCSKMGYLDQALAWFDEGIRYEEPWFRATLMGHKANFLANNGLYAEARALYEHIISLPYVKEAEKQDARNSISWILQQQAGA